LLLDIDNTILHASNIEIPKNDYQELKKQYGDEVEMARLSNQRLIFKLRPGLRTFLEAIKDKYVIFLYTYGTKEYAIEVLKYINKIFEYDYLSQDRLIARDNNDTFTYKSIKKILPTNEDIVLMLDDRIDVWKGAKNLINISCYNFFTEKMNEKKILYRPNDTDRSLYSIEKLLVFIHQAFYHIYKTKGIVKDVKIILEKKLHSIFNGHKFVLSGICKKEDIYKTSQNYVIDIFGGTLLVEYSNDVDVVIAKKYEGEKIIILGLDKIIKATSDSKLILHSTWLDYCFFLYADLKFEDFQLSPERIEMEGYPDQSTILEKNKNLIDIFYSLNEIDLFCENLEKAEMDELAVDL
jgi:FCP1-like phosphatase family protein